MNKAEDPSRAAHTGITADIHSRAAHPGRAGVLFDNPVLKRELRGRLRLRKLSGNAWRVVAAVVCLVVARYYYILLRSVVRGRADDALSLWVDVSYLALGLIVILAPALSATAISQEQEQQTWELLKMTRLSGWQVILGKWLARQSIPMLVLVIGLPLILVCGFRGNVATLSMIADYGYIILNSAFFSAMGLWCSSVIRRTPAATAVSLLLVGVLSLGTLLVDSLISMLSRTDSFDYYTMWINPFYGMYVIDDLLTGRPPVTPYELRHFATEMHTVDVSVGVELGLTIFFLTFLIRRYSRP